MRAKNIPLHPRHARIPCGRMKMNHLTAATGEEPRRVKDRTGPPPSDAQHPSSPQEHLDDCENRREQALLRERPRQPARSRPPQSGEKGTGEQPATPRGRFKANRKEYRNERGKTWNTPKPSSKYSQTGWTKLRSVFDLAGKTLRIRELEDLTRAPGLWADRRRGQEAAKQLVKLRTETARWKELQSEAAQLNELAALAQEDGNQELEQMVEEAAGTLTIQLAQEELKTLLVNPEEERPAILTVRSGAGGADAQDWAGTLLNMYSNWAWKKDRNAETLDLSYGEKAGIRSATLEIDGENAYGLLRGESGVHRVVRLSAHAPGGLRHTSFARVEVLPAAKDEGEIEIRREDIRTDTFRSSGPGGQNIQKLETAVRLTHLPTGTVVSCQTQRSQKQNREYAAKLLRAKLLRLQQEGEEKRNQQVREEQPLPEWGQQIRSYFLHPKKMVKDHVTKLSVSNADQVLAGDIDRFIEAALRGRPAGRERA